MFIGCSTNPQYLHRLTKIHVLLVGWPGLAGIQNQGSKIQGQLASDPYRIQKVGKTGKNGEKRGKTGLWYLPLRVNAVEGPVTTIGTCNHSSPEIRWRPLFRCAIIAAKRRCLGGREDTGSGYTHVVTLTCRG